MLVLNIAINFVSVPSFQQFSFRCLHNSKIILHSSIRRMPLFDRDANVQL